MKNKVSLLAILSLLTACGGGSGSSVPAPSTSFKDISSLPAISAEEEGGISPVSEFYKYNADGDKDKQASLTLENGKITRIDYDDDEKITDTYSEFHKDDNGFVIADVDKKGEGQALGLFAKEKDGNWVLIDGFHDIDEYQKALENKDDDDEEDKALKALLKDNLYNKGSYTAKDGTTYLVEGLSYVDTSRITLGSKAVGLSYSDFGIIEYNLATSGDTSGANNKVEIDEAFSAVKDGFVKSVSTETTFKGKAIGGVENEEKGKYISLSADATLDVKDNETTFNANFDNWYNVTITGDNLDYSGYKVSLDNYKNDDDSFKMGEKNIGLDNDAKIIFAGDKEATEATEAVGNFTIRDNDADTKARFAFGATKVDATK